MKGIMFNPYPTTQLKMLPCSKQKHKQTLVFGKETLKNYLGTLAGAAK